MFNECIHSNNYEVTYVHSPVDNSDFINVRGQGTSNNLRSLVPENILEQSDMQALISRTIEEYNRTFNVSDLEHSILSCIREQNLSTISADDLTVLVSEIIYEQLGEQE